MFYAFFLFTCLITYKLKLCSKSPTEVDALMYGHIYTLTSPIFPSNQGIINTICQFPKLIKHMLRIRHHYFSSGIQSEIVDEFEIIESPSKDTLWDGFQSQSESLPPLSENSFTLSMN